MPECIYVPVDLILVPMESSSSSNHTNPSSLPYVDRIPSIQPQGSSLVPSVSYEPQGSSLVSVSFSVHLSSSMNVDPIQTRSKTHSLQAFLTSIENSDQFVNNEPKSIHQALLRPH